MKTKQRAGRRSRVLRTAAQRQELVQAWRAAGVTQAKYCARHGIHPTTFSTWCRKAPKATGGGQTKAGVKFAEFKMALGGMAPVEVAMTRKSLIKKAKY